MEAFVEGFKSLLRTGGQKALAIALGCAFLLWIDHHKIFILSSRGKETIVIFGAISACFAIISFITAIIKWLHPKINEELRKFYERRKVKKYLPYLTEKDKEIIAYLLAKNQKIFLCDSDGEEARTLRACGFVICALQPGQVFIEGEVPHVIPENVWAVLVKNKNLFPYQPEKDGDIKTDPWRTPWMVKRI